jgi:hypothetical protein
MHSIEQLLVDLNREFVYGPTAMYVTVHDRPHN